MNPLIIGIFSFATMELVSYLAHRYVYHGIGWVFHRSHHTRREGIFELNDIFPMIFSVIAISLMLWGFEADADEVVAAAIGVSAYGMIYFIIHDLYIHRRAKWLSLRIPFLLEVKKAHAIHHKYGGEPFGLLLFFRKDEVRNQQDISHETVV
ncbi:MAG: sterol desaturase family protein [Ignavibacteria bacterium]|nr:sterol desaturase family protein [Ignavibacteria bacterium]